MQCTGDTTDGPPVPRNGCFSIPVTPGMDHRYCIWGGTDTGDTTDGPPVQFEGSGKISVKTHEQQFSDKRHEPQGAAVGNTEHPRQHHRSAGWNGGRGRCGAYWRCRCHWRNGHFHDAFRPAVLEHGLPACGNGRNGSPGPGPQRPEGRDEDLHPGNRHGSFHCSDNIRDTVSLHRHSPGFY